ncbi:MAG: helix-turn-helix domain-containing protein [Stenotrophobium sp.]
MPATPRQEPIPFITLPSWVKAAAKCGFNIEPVFREHGIQTDLVHLESASVDPLSLEKVMGRCVQLAHEFARGTHFPFVLGETFAFDYLPDLETFVTTAPTLRQAARVFEWVRTLINPFIDVRIEERGRHAYLLMDVGTPDGRAANPYFIELLFATVHKFFRALTREQAQVEQMTFRYHAPAYAALYEAFFHVQAHFGRRRNAAVFDRRLLDAPLGGAFPTLHRQAEYLVEQRVRKLPRKPGLLAAIETVFAEHPELLGQGIASVATHIGLGPRTLQRRLRDEGQSFDELHTHARFRAAMRLLETSPEDIDTISERLGFSDRRSFTRAFKRWNGSTPSDFRSRATKLPALTRKVPSGRARS